MDAAPGLNIKYFSPAVPETNNVNRVTASSSSLSTHIYYAVKPGNIEKVRKCLSEMPTFAVDEQPSEFDTAFKVFDEINIKKSLDLLRLENLIDDQFYQTIVRNFPQPYGKTIDLSSRIIVAPNCSFDTRTLALFRAYMALLTPFKLIKINKSMKLLFDEILKVNPSHAALEAIDLISKEGVLNEEDEKFLRTHDIYEIIDLIRRALAEHSKSKTPPMPETSLIDSSIMLGYDRLPLSNIAIASGINHLIRDTKLKLAVKIMQDKGVAELLVTKVKEQAEKLVFLNLEAQILGRRDNAEARLVRSALTGS